MPLPGRLPAWSPVSVLVDGKPEAALRRDDGYLWVVLVFLIRRGFPEAAIAILLLTAFALIWRRLRGIRAETQAGSGTK